MKLENQVTSLELSKRLRELGVKKQSWFFWVKLRDNNAETTWKLVYANDKRLQKPDMYEWCNAYTVAELGEMLPWKVEYEHEELGKYMGQLKSQKIDDDKFPWNVSYITKHGEYIEIGKTEAEARGLMLEYLIKNNLMSV